MSEHSDLATKYAPEINELRLEVERLRTELADLRQAHFEQAATLSGQPAAEIAGSSVIGSPLITGQYNTADTQTVLQATRPGITLGVLNPSQGTATTGTPVGLYAAAQGIGMIVTAYGTAPFPATSKAVQAFCDQGVAVFADSRWSSAVYAHTTNGSAAIVADQESANPQSVAVTALGGNGIGVYASGATAALQLGRSSAAGSPTTGFHEAGELMLDANADLYLCKATGTPGTWSLIG